MRKRFFARTILISLISILVFAICSSFILYAYDKQSQSEKLSVFLKTVTSEITLDTTDYQNTANKIQNIYGDPLRITLIDSNGTVLADTEVDASSLENHADRNEVSEAILFGEGSSVRYSATLRENELYYALRTSNGTIIRAMIPISNLWTDFLHFLPYLILSAAVAMLTSVFISKSMSRSALRPLTDIAEKLVRIGEEDYTVKLPYSDFDELNPLVKSANQLSERISLSMHEIKQEKDKLDYILNNISQGVILLDENFHVVHCNKAAELIFGVLEDKKPATLFEITRNTNLIKAVEKAQEYETSKFELVNETEQRTFHVSVMPNNSIQYEKNIFIILTDITQSKNNEKIRKEFFSYASHELRTPITSIMGFAELMSAHHDQTIDEMKEYATVIHKESEKLSALLEDILKISSLEESGKSPSSELIHVNKEIRELMDFPSIRMNEKNIQIHLNLDPNVSTLLMESSDFSSLIMNLAENALKYGKQEGHLWITTKQDGHKLQIIIQDDGIGIQKTDLDRIFERFYRADKSRNNKTKGTGLGLAIVKHIVLKYNGEISVKSDFGKGTAFTLTFSAAV